MNVRIRDSAAGIAWELFVWDNGDPEWVIQRYGDTRRCNNKGHRLHIALPLFHARLRWSWQRKEEP